MTVHNALVGAGLRDRIKIGASGKVATGSDIVKRLIQGADYTNAARAMMMAVGCIQAQRCHTNTCPVGVATQDPRRARALDVADKTARVQRYQEATVTAGRADHGLDGRSTTRPSSRRTMLHAPRSTTRHVAATPSCTTGSSPASCCTSRRPWATTGRRPTGPLRAPRRADRRLERRTLVTHRRRAHRRPRSPRQGVRTVWGVVGDALNPVTDAIRRERRHRVDRRPARGGGRVRRLRAGAADRHARRLHGHGRARARSTCSTASTTRRSRTRRCSRSAARCRSPSSAATTSRRSTTTRCSRDVAVFRQHGHEPASSCRSLLEHAVQSALTAARRRRADAARRRRRARPAQGHAEPRFVDARRPTASRTPTRCTRPPRCIDDAGRSRCSSASAPARRAPRCSRWPRRWPRPMVLTLKAKEGLERDNPFQVGQTGLIGNPAARHALRRLRRAADARHRLPVPRTGTRRARSSCRSTPGARTSAAARAVDVGARRATPARRCRRCSTAADGEARPRPPRGRPRRYATGASASSDLADPAYDETGWSGKLRAKLDNPRARGSAPRRSPTPSTAHAAPDAIFTSDTGMSTVWLSRFVDHAAGTGG